MKLRSRCLQKALVIVLGDLAMSDEVQKNRYIALRLLGDACVAFRDTLHHKVTLLSFNICLRVLLRLFPVERTSDLNRPPFCEKWWLRPHPQILNAEVHAIDSISRFLGLPPAQANEPFMRYIDALFAYLLSPKAPKVIVIAVLRALSQHLPLTNRNRTRVEVYFRTPIRILVDTFIEKGVFSRKVMAPENGTLQSLPLTEQGLDAAEANRDSAPDDHTGIIDQPKLSMKDPLLLLLQRELYRFWSVWFPLPPDAAILKLSEENIRRMGDGCYVARRRAFLKSKRDDRKILSCPYPEGPMATEVFFWKREKVIAKDIIASCHSSVSELSFDSSDGSTLVFEPNSLNVIVPQPLLLFNRHPPACDITIRNTSTTHPVLFHVQVEPAGMFIVEPSVGVAGPRETVLARITCIGGSKMPWMVSRGTIVDGWLKVRSGFDAWSVERVPLRAYRFPILSISGRSLSFGICPPGDSRTFPVYISNLADADVAVALAIPSGRKIFNVTPSSQIILAARETKQIAVQFTPSIDSRRTLGENSTLTDSLVVVTIGGEVHKILLHGVVGETLGPIPQMIDFGSVDINHPGITRHMLLRNSDSVFPLPLGFEISTDDIMVNDGHPLVLKPGAVEKVPIAFRSSLVGERSETLRVFGPGLLPRDVKITSFSGPSVLFPIANEIFLGPLSQATSGLYSVTVPIYNISSSTANVVLAVRKGMGFGIGRQSDRDVSDSEEITWGSIESYPEYKECRGGILGLPPNSRAMMDLCFHPLGVGTFRADLIMRVVHPRPEPEQRITLNAMAIPTADVPSLQTLRTWWKKPFLEPPSSSMSKLEGENDFDTEISWGNSEVLYFDQQNQTVVATDEAGATIFENVTLTNASQQKQPFRLVISHPFETDIPLDGLLDPGTSIDIPLRYAPLKDKEPQSNNVNQITAVGSICVVDAFNFVRTVPLFGVWKSMVSVEMRGGTRDLKFSRTQLNNKSSRKLLLRNKSASTISLEGRVNSLGQRASSSKNNQNNLAPTSGEGLVYFSLSQQRLTLRPWDSVILEINFQGIRSGLNKAHLFLEQQDSLSRVSASGDRANESIKNRRPVLSLSLLCEVGDSSWIVECDSVDFGAVSLDETATKLVNIKSEWAADATLLFSTTQPAIVGTIDRNLPAMRVSEIPLMCHGTRTGLYNWFFQISGSSCSKSLALVARIGSHKILADKCVPLITPRDQPSGIMEIKPDVALSNIMKQSVVDFGQVSLNDTSVKSIRLTNAGTLGIAVSHIAVRDPIRLHWTVDNRNSDYELPFEPSGNSWLDSAEIDWDEVYAQSLDGFGSRTTQKMVATKRPRRFDVTTTAGSIGTKSAKNLFPIRMEPGRSLDLILRVANLEQGLFQTVLNVDFERSGGEPYRMEMIVQGNAQPPLRLLEKKLEFGVKPVRGRSTFPLKFENPGQFAVPWEVRWGNTSFRHHSRHPRASDMSNTLLRLDKYEMCPFDVFPTSGVLAPGCIQTLDVTFRPTLSETEVSSKLTLVSTKFCEFSIDLHGIGGSTRFVCSQDNIDFSTLRIGISKEKTISISNRGILQSRYFIESSDAAFTTEPEQGILEGDGDVDISVSFKPRRAGSHFARLLIFGRSLEGAFHLQPVVIQLCGVGGYPEIICHTKVLDFGTALYMMPNYRHVSIQNKGSAEAEIQFDCSHASITLAEDEDGIILAHQTKEIRIQYMPTTVEVLDIKGFIRSSDSRGDYCMITLRGTVGVPKLEVVPKDFSSLLDFGICSIGTTSQRELSIVNTGNISLNFAILLTKRRPLPEPETTTSAAEPVTITPQSGKIEVGQSILISIKFSPAAMVQYQFQTIFNYDFHMIEGVLKGFGGAAKLKVALPHRVIDFGVCRLGHPFKKRVALNNEGNVGTFFHVRPHPKDGNWSVYEEEITRNTGKEAEKNINNMELPQLEHDSASRIDWVAELYDLGLRILTPDGYCGPDSRVELVFEYLAECEAPISTSVRTYFGDRYEEFTVLAKSSVPKLDIYGYDGRCLSGAESAPLDLGVHRVGSHFKSFLSLSNESPFGLDFFVQPTGLQEFEVSPQRGHVPAESSVPLSVVFKPHGEERVTMDLKILWEKETLCALIVGSGGLGRIDIEFTEEADQKCGYLEFGMVPFNTSSEKRFYVCNTGMVEVAFHVLVDNPEFGITVLSDPMPLEDRKKGLRQRELHLRRTTKLQWFASVSCVVSPGSCIELGSNFTSKAPAISQGYIRVMSESGNKSIQVRGRGGTINLGHRGDLSFGDISSNFVYSRTLTLFNTGSIPAFCDLEWSVVGHNVDATEGKVTLVQSYVQHDPRSGWARQQVLNEKNLPITTNAPRFGAKDYWQMIRISVLFTDHIVRIASEDTAVVNTLSKSKKSQVQLALDLSGTTQSKKKSGRIGRMADHSKRKQSLYQLVASSQLTSQSTAKLHSYIKVEPTSILIPSYEEVTIMIEACLLTEETFLATLLCRPQVPNTPPHEIALSATPKAVSILCDDVRALNFYRQPINEPETLVRTFSNVGHKDITFRIRNENLGLSIMPSKGSLRMGQSITIQFTFRAADEYIQNLPVTFEADCSQPIRFNFFGAGGAAKASLAKYRRFDFGHCMIGKNTTSFLPIANEGNAILHLTKFELEETDTFICGQDWPTGRVSLPPGKTFNLPIVFNPQEENPPAGKLTVGTMNERWTIELVGAGREAVLIISRSSLEYSDCIIGNRYEQRLDLKNVGDVNYPITFRFDSDCSDLRVTPSTLTILPFSESSVMVGFVPTKETKRTVVLEVTSPYSHHRVPINLHAGSVTLEFSVESLDFGMFEKSTRPELKFSIKNVGTVKTSYHLKDSSRPSRFHITNSKGNLPPKKIAELTITTIRYEVGSFKEKLVLKTDLVNRPLQLVAHGQCEEALLQHEEFNYVNLGLCPVSDVTNKTVIWRNYGRFPLSWSMKFAYPVKASPASGVTLGGETTTCHISWTPSGAYELRTAISLVTNIGTYPISVRGKALFPEIGIRSVFVDFGVCAIGTTYTETISITNKGKVPLAWQIPPPKEHYTLSKSEGWMLPKESDDIRVSFTPPSFGKFTSNLLVECKGINYKEVALLGVGGRMNLDISPTALQLGTLHETRKCPCNHFAYGTIVLTNNGDVTLHCNFTISRLESEVGDISLPEPLTLKPNRSARCVIGLACRTMGRFQQSLNLVTKERTYELVATGYGIKVSLTDISRRLLQEEALPYVSPPPHP
ncbi:hypothetical protein M427DRAFT_486646 [Gonapodya prolifera JEL478]|uniref:MSP domain-containing protein n=1 Tax=Gonapodya prolifera (strain JEL478) TaxID=1344416 RepID=A0A139APX3_GONPJ|nr:hypothetical protein M427DRAFT_486646 [Gonapodya prolifera JEL478]|eukprot:KXS18811.1 hypothetical protein M427DRAFT_486646 [Gonapodya prolifera JEL478]